MEIERKFLVNNPMKGYSQYPCREIEQGYLSSDPEIRIRKEDNTYILTIKSKGSLVREEYNYQISKETYSHLLQKVDGNILTKKRFLIPLENNLIAELDIFEGNLNCLMTVEVEFKSEEDARRFIPPNWFGKDVTYSSNYKNYNLSKTKGGTSWD